MYRRKTAQLVCVAAGVVGAAGWASAATPVSYTATAAPSANPDGVDQTNTPVDVWQEVITPGTSGGAGSYSNPTWYPGAWTLYSYNDATGGSIDEYHTFAGGAISVGQTVSIGIANSAIATGQHVGFSLIDGGSPINFYFVGGDSSGHYRYDDAGGTDQDTGLGFEYQTPITVSITLTSATTYSATAGTASWSGTYSGAITEMDVYNHAAGDGSDLGYDNLTVSAVPEPVSAGLIGVLGVPALLRRRRR